MDGTMPSSDRAKASARRTTLAGAPGRRRLALISAIPAVLIAAQAQAQPDPRRVFDIPGGRTTSIIVSRSADQPKPDDLASPMLKTLAGVIAQLPEREVARLRAMVRAAPPAPPFDHADLLGILHLRGPGAEKRVEILRAEGVGLIASEIDPLGPSAQPAAALLPDAFESIVAQWEPFRAGFGPTETPIAQPIDLPHPYVASPFTFDEALISERFAAGATHRIRAALRDLDAETIWVRLPRGYDPRTPAGLLVWNDPSDSGRPPDFMHPAADEHNFIIVAAAHAGNNRVVSDRHQLAFDAIANARTQFHIDTSRIYSVGVSGGGRLASMQAAAFPDVFRGAVCIVGLSSFRRIPVEGGSLPAAFALRPQAIERLRDRRIAAITGPRDPNNPEIVAVQRLMDVDRVPVRVFSYADMGHEQPTPERFAEGLAWVDQPWRDQHTDGLRVAERLLQTFRQQYQGDPGPLSPAQRDMLIRITATAPWSAPAWEAARLLGAVPPP